jgi:hypothetical protein
MAPKRPSKPSRQARSTRSLMVRLDEESKNYGQPPSAVPQKKNCSSHFFAVAYSGSRGSSRHFAGFQQLIHADELVALGGEIVQQLAETGVKLVGAPRASAQVQ